MDLERLKTSLLHNQFLKKNWLALALALLGLSLIILSLMLRFLWPFLKPEIEIIPSKEASSSAKIYVHVAGAVQKPGLYELNQGSRVNDALIASQGLAENANRDWFSKNINLAQPLQDGAKIYIPYENESGTISGFESGSALINLNTASLIELDRLPGIGPAISQKIIDYRTKNGSFSQIEDLLKVPGIGNSLFEQLKDKLTI